MMTALFNLTQAHSKIQTICPRCDSNPCLCPTLFFALGVNPILAQIRKTSFLSFSSGFSLLRTVPLLPAGRRLLDSLRAGTMDGTMCTRPRNGVYAPAYKHRSSEEGGCCSTLFRRTLPSSLQSGAILLRYVLVLDPHISSFSSLNKMRCIN